MSPYRCPEAARCQEATRPRIEIHEEGPVSGRQPTEEDFHRRLVAVIRERGWSDAEIERRLARALAKDRPNKGYLSRLIAERRSPTLRLALALAAALEVRPAWLLAGDGPMERGKVGGEKISCVAS